MTRTNAREIAAHLLYALEYTGQPADEAIAARLEPDYYQTLSQESQTYLERPNKKQRAYICALVSGVCEKREELNRIIAKFSIGWNLSRISRLARTFLQIALYECLYLEDVPSGVAVNEAVKLTKTYDEDAARFVNGILGAFLRGGAQLVAPEEPTAPEQEAAQPADKAVEEVVAEEAPAGTQEDCGSAAGEQAQNAGVEA